MGKAEINLFSMLKARRRQEVLLVLKLQQAKFRIRQEILPDKMDS